MFELASRNGSIDLFVAHKQQMLAQYYLKNVDLKGTDGEVVGWVEDDAILCGSSLTLFKTRHSFRIRHKRKRNNSHQTLGGLNNSLKRGVSLKRNDMVTKGRKSVGKEKQKSVGKEKQKVNEDEAIQNQKIQQTTSDCEMQFRLKRV
nr:hypothetical protein [Tanacetum cinerariifolium]